MFWQNRNLFVLANHIYLLGLFIRIGEKLFQGYIQKSFLVINNYKKIWNHAKTCFWCTLSIAPPFPPQSSVFQNLGVERSYSAEEKPRIGRIKLLYYSLDNILFGFSAPPIN